VVEKGNNERWYGWHKKINKKMIKKCGWRMDRMALGIKKDGFFDFFWMG
jgi:hypothetical protein